MTAGARPGPGEPAPHTDDPHAGRRHTDGAHTDDPHADGPQAGRPHTDDPHADDPHADGPHADPRRAAGATRRTAVRESVVAGTDPGDAAEYLRGVVGARELRFGGVDAGDHRFAFRYRSTGDGSVSLRTASCSGAASGWFALGRQYVLAWTTGSAVAIDDDDGDGIALRTGIPVMLPAGRPFHASAEAGTVHSVHLDADFLEAVAVVDSDAAPAPLRFPVEAPADRLALLQEVLREVARPLLDVSVADGDRAVLDVRLAEAVLEVFGPVPGTGEHEAPLGTVARAKAYIEAHFDRPLTATVIAAAADVSVRTLQESFQRHEGTTPMNHLRDLRLEKARIGLQLADHRETSVAEVAQACGFRHMGRFSGAYVAAYGEYPGDTLRGQRFTGVGQ